VQFAKAVKLLGVSRDAGLCVDIYSVLTIVSESVKKNQQNFRIFCAI